MFIVLGDLISSLGRGGGKPWLFHFQIVFVPFSNGKCKRLLKDVCVPYSR